MEKVSLKKQLLIEKMADHLLEHGLSDFTLRSLGAATGTSDRMLLHYFVDKDELLSATLLRVSERLIAQLSALQLGKLSPPQLIGFLASLLRSPEVIPFTNLWLELTAVSIRKGGPYRTVAAQIADAFLAWISASLNNEGSPDHAETCAYILSMIEGMVVLSAVGKEAEAERAVRWMLRVP